MSQGTTTLLRNVVVTDSWPVTGCLFVGWSVYVVWVRRPSAATHRLLSVEQSQFQQSRHQQLRAGGALSLIDRVGELLQRRFRSLSVVSPRFVGGAVMAGLISAPLVGLVGTAVALAVLGAGVFAARRRLDRGRLVLLGELASLLELVRIGVSVGYTIRGATEAAVRFTPFGQVAGLDHVAGCLQRGMTFEAALDMWSIDVGEPADEVAALLTSAGESGTSVTMGLANLAADLARQQHHSALVRARRLPVTMLPPLIFCVLPAFGLVTVIPMITVGLQQLSGGP